MAADSPTMRRSLRGKLFVPATGQDLMPEYYPAAKVGDIPEGKGMAYAINGRMVAIFRL